MNSSATDMATTQAAWSEKRLVALTSIGAAIVLTAMKLVVGLLTGSLGLLAEAAHSGLDLVAAIMTYFAVRVSDKPADAEHLYGHGKVENLSAAGETLLLLITCGWIIYEALERLLVRAVHVEATFWAFLVILISIVIDVSRSRALMRVARKHKSQALEADALHFSTDVWSSAVVLIGLVLVKVGDVFGRADLLQRADAVAALLVAVLVVWVSLRLGRRTIDALLDRAPAGLVPAVQRAVVQIDGVAECRGVRLRESGTRTFVDLTIGVRRDIPLETSHAITEAAEERIRALVPNADVVVHVEPVRDIHETLAERVRTIAATQGQTVHNILSLEEDGRLSVELHMETDAQLDLRQAHARVDALEAAICSALPEVASVTTHIEPHRERRETLQNVTDVSVDLLERVRQIVANTPAVAECHELTLRHSGREMFLSMHCTFEPGCSVREVHEISTELESRLRAAIPNLVRVTTHAEPAEP